MKKICLVIMLIIVIVSGCGGGGGKSTGGNSGSSGNSGVNGVSLSLEQLTLTPGDQGTLVAVVAPATTFNTNVTWSSSDESVVIVAESGVVTAVAVGSATITVTTVVGSKTARCAVSVAEEGSENNTTTYGSLPSSITLNKTELTLAGGSTEALMATVLPDTATQEVSWITSNSGVAVVSTSGLITAGSSGNAIITASTINGLIATCAVTVTSGQVVIRASDSPSGWAGYTGNTDLSGAGVSAPTNPGGYGGTVYNVATRAELIAALADSSSKIIYISGMIDMTEGMLPATATDTTAALDDFIAIHSAAAGVSGMTANSYAAWKGLYAANVVSTADQSGDIATVRNYLNNKWKTQVQLSIPSNTTIIGSGVNCGIKGGCISINGKRNVVLRNLLIQDGFNPFPKLEANDGLNADYDNISIQNSKYIWIDHCTMEDTLATTDAELGKVTTGNGVTLKWQAYDGLCDITNANDFVTVSWCILKNHDKTMLIGSSDSATGDANHQTVSLHHNYFLNCASRLPMVRFATIHIYNNYFDRTGGRSNSYAIGVRKQSKIVAENNFFGSGIGKSFENNLGSLYVSGNIDNSKSGNTSTTTTARPWHPGNYYSYTLDEAAKVPEYVTEGAGAGVGIIEM